ncbi:aspirochlorine biosynthesis cytochrome P450 monooxygenase [Microdochium nivale]|nr:aspirochlorine biosynthesis cytochrome P450 monooxygenase [Microdochium nivale]
MNALASDGGVRKAVHLLGGLAASLVVFSISTVVYRIWLHPLSKILGPKHLAAADIFNLYITHVSMKMSPYAVKLHRKYGPIVRIGPDRVIVDESIAWSQVHGVRSTSEENEFNKIPGYIMPRDNLGLIAANREVHRRQRRQIGNAFSVASLREQEGIIKGYVDKLMAEIELRARKQETLDIVDWLNYVTFDIIGDLTFADSFGSLEGDTEFVDNVFIGLKGQAFSTFLTFFPLMKAPLMLLMGKELSVAQKAGVANKQLGIEKARDRMANDDKIKESGRRDFATSMLRRGKDGEEVLTRDEVEVNSALIVAAGSETTATALSGALFFLSRSENASKLQRVVDEVYTAFSDESDIDTTSTGRLQYLAAVIEESLRMYPPAVAFPPRRSPGAEVGGYWLPKGTDIHFDSVATNRNPDSIFSVNVVYKQTDIRLSHWLNASHPLHISRYDSDRKDVFKPFSAGARDCIGKNLAYAEMRTILARFLFRFEYEVLPGQDDWITTQVSMPFVWVKKGYELRPKLRNRQVVA